MYVSFFLHFHLLSHPTERHHRCLPGPWPPRPLPPAGCPSDRRCLHSPPTIRCPPAVSYRTPSSAFFLLFPLLTSPRWPSFLPLPSARSSLSPSMTRSIFALPVSAIKIPSTLVSSALFVFQVINSPLPPLLVCSPLSSFLPSRSRLLNLQVCKASSSSPHPLISFRTKFPIKTLQRFNQSRLAGH